MRLCLCRHKSTRPRRDRRGQATVIGSIFFFVIAMTLITFFYEVAQNQIVMQQHDAERVTEAIDAELLVTDVGLIIFVKNNGPISAKLIGLWVIDLDKDAPNDPIRYDIPDAKCDVFPWEKIEISTDDVNPGWVSLNEEHEYSIRLVTARGNIIEPKPFSAVSGTTVTIVTYPPWVSLGETGFSTDPEETPIPWPEISTKPDEVEAYDGGKLWLSIKNTGEITFFLTFDSRVIFKETAPAPGEEFPKCYSSSITKWEIREKENGQWKKVSDGTIDQNKDSRAVYPDEVIILEFEKPQEAPGERGDIPPGEYHVYLHLAGYDDNGNAYFQDIYYGIVIAT